MSHDRPIRWSKLSRKSGRTQSKTLGVDVGISPSALYLRCCNWLLSSIGEPIYKPCIAGSE
ncbi:frataxin [Mus musculus]|nr:frataxin [Mus musculus]